MSVRELLESLELLLEGGGLDISVSPNVQFTGGYGKWVPYEKEQLPLVLARARTVFERFTKEAMPGYGHYLTSRFRFMLLRSDFKPPYDPTRRYDERYTYAVLPKARKVQLVHQDDFGFPRDAPDSVYPSIDAALEEIPANPQWIYRGMALEEFLKARRAGAFESHGTHNLPGQEGLTFFSGDPETARYYAGGFAPLAFKATRHKPGVVIALDPKSMKVLTHKDRPQDVPAGELAIAGRVPVSLVQGIWMIVPVKTSAGKLEVVLDGARNRVGEGTRFDPSSRVALIDATNRFPQIAAELKNAPAEK